MSKRNVKTRLTELIDKEDSAKPLSDQEIYKRLNAEGIKLARRTVTKYREELKIPSARFRKRVFGSDHSSDDDPEPEPKGSNDESDPPLDSSEINDGFSANSQDSPPSDRSLNDTRLLRGPVPPDIPEPRSTRPYHES